MGAAGLSRRLVPIPIPRALARLNRDVRLFMVSAVATGFCYTGLYFLLISLYLLRMGYGVEFIGVFISTGAFSFALFSLPAGAASRRWGSRRPMIFGVCVLSFGLAMLALSALLPGAWQPIWLLSFCALREWGNAFYLVNANPYLMSVTQSEERAHVFSTRAILTPLAGFAGALLGGWLPALSAALFALDERDPLCYVAPMLLASLLLLPGLGCLVLAGEGGEETTPSASQERGARPLNAMLAVGLVSLLFIVAVSAGQSFYSVYMDSVLDSSTETIGLVTSLGQLASAVLMLGAPAVLARWGHARSFVGAAIFLGLSIVPIALIAHWLAAGLSVIGIAFLMAFGSTALTLFHQELVHPGWRAAMSGASMMTMGFGWGLVASGGGFFISALGWTAFFLTAALLTACAAAAFWLYFVRNGNVRMP